MDELKQIAEGIEMLDISTYSVADITAINPSFFTYENPATYVLFLKYNEGKLTEEEIDICHEIIAKLKHNQEIVNARNIAYMERHLAAAGDEKYEYTLSAAAAEE